MANIAIKLAEKEIDRAHSAVVTAERKYQDAQERLDETEVRSPIDGMIVTKYRNVGEMIQSGTQSLTGGTVLMEVADVDQVFMLASVDEADIGQVRAMAPPEARPGADPSAATQPAAAMGNGGGNPNKPTSTQPTTQMVEQDTIEEDTEVTITVEAFPDDKFKGVIERIWPEAETRQAVATFQVRIRLTSENRDKVRHLVNMQAEAEFTSVPMKDVLLVPYEAVRRGPGDDLGVYVPVPKEDGRGERPKFVPCKFGPDNGIDVVVLKGVEDGQRIYTKLPIKTQREREAEEAEET
jgi:multidrug efflux pump subunit AcrA (membrane-fusion protein)